jgi:hypothetical protein
MPQGFKGLKAITRISENIARSVRFQNGNGIAKAQLVSKRREKPMKNLTRLLIVIVCVFLLVPVSAVQPVRAANNADTEFVKFLEDAWVNAIVHKNFDVLELEIANDFIGVSPNGQRYGKAEAIADLKTGAYTVESMKMNNVNVRIFGDTALVMFYQDEKSKYLDEDCSGRYAFTDLWVKRGGVWQVVASHGVQVTLP